MRLKIWSFRLTLAQAVFFVLRHGVRGTTIVACHASRPASAFLGLIGARLLVRESNLSVKDRDGVNIRVRAESRLARIVDSLLPASTDRSWLPPEQQAWGNRWIRILAANAVDRCQREVDWITLTEAANSFADDDELIVFVSCAPFEKEVATRLDLDLEIPWSAKPWYTLRSLLGFWPIPGTVVSNLLRAMPAFWNPRPAAHIPDNARKAGVFMLQAAMVTMREDPLRFQLDWLKGSGVAPERVVLLLNRPDCPLGPEIKAFAARHGLSWVDGANPLGHLDRPIMDSMARVWAMGVVLPRRWSRLETWRWGVLTANAPLFESYRQMMRRYNVRLLQQVEEFYTQPMLLALAARQSNALFTWDYWSAHNIFLAWYRHAIADIFFAWGEHDIGFNDAVGFEYGVAVQVGVVSGDYRDPDNERAQRRTLRERFSSDVEKVLLILDSAYGPGVHYTEEQVVTFYRRAFETVAGLPNVGCLTKTRGDVYATLPETPGLQDLATELEARGCLIHIHTDQPVSAAAVAADAALAFGMNTAGVLAGLHGIPSIQMAVSNAKGHPLVESGGLHGIVFEDLEDIPRLIRAMLFNNADGVGDFAPWSATIDAFADGRGRLRKGAFVRHYLDACKKGADAVDALEQAVLAYSNAHGADKIVRAGERPDTRGGRSWRAVRDEFYGAWPGELGRG